MQQERWYIVSNYRTLISEKLLKPNEIIKGEESLRKHGQLTVLPKIRELSSW